MKKRFCILFSVFYSAMLLTACKNGVDTGEKADPPTRSQSDKMIEKAGGENIQNMIIEIGGEKFKAILYDNATAKALFDRLPMTIRMDELNGNEKFYYLDEPLPAASENVDKIHAGDIMLFGDVCLVLFFEDFTTSYNYTRIGYIENKEGFIDTISGFSGQTVGVTLETSE